MQRQSQSSPGRASPGLQNRSNLAHFDADSAATQQRHDDSPALAARIETIGARHGFELDAAQALWRALSAGHGSMAQFAHPALGGSGQWMRGGMTMIGDMFNRELAARVGALADALAALFEQQPEPAAASSFTDHGAGADWWPAGLRDPGSSGAQNGVRYAYFPAQRRLAIERGGKVELYDTGEHRIAGVSQQQAGSGTAAFRNLNFSSQHGSIDLATLQRVPAAGDWSDPADAVVAPQAAVNPKSDAVADPVETLKKLALLRESGVLTDAEFDAKKTELLRRI